MQKEEEYNLTNLLRGQAMPRPALKPSLISQRPIQEQQKHLFDAFYHLDENYIYPFDEDTRSFHRQQTTKFYAHLLTYGMLCLTNNAIYYSQLRPRFNKKEKLFFMVVSNGMPFLFTLYQLLKQKDTVDAYLYEKYLRK